MSVINTVSAAPPLESRSLASAADDAGAIPWTIWLAFIGVVTLTLGSIVDVSWHKSVGRDAFWTPGHTMMGFGGMLIGIATWCEILATTRAGAARKRESSVRVLGLYGPAGAVLATWGGVAMLASSPFDNWWHNAYGLDLKIITPPHLLLILGWFAAQIGALLWLASMINRSTGVLQDRLVRLFLIVAAIHVMFAPTLSFVSRRTLHTAVCYLTIAVAFPAAVIATGRASRHRWGCTLITAGYMAIGIASIWVLPLIPAQPKIGPVYQNVTHLIPPQFPLLLIASGFIADLLLRRLESRSSWTKALLIGPAFVLSLIAVQWPFADFLMSAASRNWIFGTAYLPYYALSGSASGAGYDIYQFAATEKSGPFVVTMVVALVASILTTRFGLAWGDWMRRIRR
jgi:hypothetical protein